MLAQASPAPFLPHGWPVALEILTCLSSTEPARGAGAFSDADVVRWHPNAHYVAAGSSDRTIRIWDIRGGSLQRILTGHRAPVMTSVTFAYNRPHQ